MVYSYYVCCWLWDNFLIVFNKEEIDETGINTFLTCSTISMPSWGALFFYTPL
jgi:hypothetical protein